MKEVQQIEAIKYALRQSKDGIVVSFVIHPEDLDPALQILPIGKRIMFGWYEIGDDEKPLPVAQRIEPPTSNRVVAGSTPAGEAKARRKFSELSLPEQAGIRCADPHFRTWLPIRERIDGIRMLDTESTADIVRAILGVTSRSELSHNHDAANRWRKIDAEYERWLTTQQYADSVR